MKFTFAPETKPLAGYTIKRAIDRGGFGEVYYALSDSGKEVALKLLQRNQQVELRGVSQCLNLKHPNLVTLFDIKTDDEGDSWVVMEFVSGKSLEQVLDGQPRGLPAEEVEQWLTGMAAGTSFLHDRGVVHRDLKPANVFRENGVVKIGDVGLSKFITPSRRSAQTESVGTVYYMAPEVAHGKYGSELDVYSLGIMTYEMLTGRVPFNGESTAEILMKHLTEPPDLSAVSPAFRPVLARALEKDPQRRTPTATQLADEFRRAMRGDAPVAVEASPRPTSPPPRDTAPYSQQRGSVWKAHPAARKFNDALQRFPVAFPVLLAFGLYWLLSASSVGGRGGPPFAFKLGIFPMVLCGVAVYLFVRTWKKSQEWQPARHPLASPPPPPPQRVHVPPPPPKPAERPVQVAVKKQSRINPKNLLPTAMRPVALRERMADLSSSMAWAVVWSLLATAGLGFFTPLFGESNNVPADWGRAGLFALVAVAGSWAVLVPAKLWEGTSLNATTRRIMTAALGAGVGAFAFWLDETLLVDLVYRNEFRDSLFEEVGKFKLIADRLQPTLAGYMVYFAALFGVRRWWWQADAFRSRKFRVSTLVFTGILAALIPAVLVFPQTWSVAWAAAISAAVQVSASWTPPEQRLAVMEGK